MPLSAPLDANLNTEKFVYPENQNTRKFKNVKNVKKLKFKKQISKMRKINVLIDKALINPSTNPLTHALQVLHSKRQDALGPSKGTPRWPKDSLQAPQDAPKAPPGRLQDAPRRPKTVPSWSPEARESAQDVARSAEHRDTKAIRSAINSRSCF